MKRNVLRLGIALLVVVQVACGGQPTREGLLPGPGTESRIAELNTKLGVGYIREGKLELAHARLTTALEADPNYSTAHNAMGLLYDRLNQTEKAEEHFKKAVRLTPSDSAAQINYGGFLCRHGRVDEGVERFSKALENALYDKPEIAYTNAALCKRSAGDLAAAETYFRKALQINPKLPVVLLNMAELSYEKERYLPARGYLQRYLEVAKHTPRSLWLGIRVERVLGDRDTASSYAMLLKANYPDSRETQLLLESGEQ